MSDTVIAEEIKIPKRLDTEEVQMVLEHVKSLLEQEDHAQDENLQKYILHLHPADIAYILESLPKEERLQVWELVNSQYDGDILLEVDDWVREDLIASMNREDLLAATETLDADELADLAPDLPAEIVAEVQKGLTERERSQLLEAMGYEEGTVGAIMDFDMVRVREDITLEVVLRYLRRLDYMPDHTDQIFIIDRQEHLLGTLSLADLLVNDPERNVRDFMNTDFFSLSPEEEDTVATSAFERYDLVSAPVVDKENRLIGRVTINEVVDVMREDSQEQDLARAGLEEEDMFASTEKAVRNRTPWLLINLCTASTASFIAAQFEGTVGKIVILAFLMSIVAGIGGNSGNQTLTLVIRAIAMGRISSKSLWTMLKRETWVTMLVGLTGSILASFFAWLVSGSYKIALVMVIAMICNMIIGAALGVIIPLLQYKFDRDPAVGSSVLLTFATDALGFFIFLGLASLFLL
ncbi:magnesium transporter [Pelistega europaea]|uniref:Magnesium transporter MgtE n=1 Tax=Pelistega europaea TaxID=106147 RepID=A0A7Y4P3P4_9BURK|nr:magnesium transporter [Pelistega europaea]NOL49227.1 magnesium transporter [Pelistega europaea]